MADSHTVLLARLNETPIAILVLRAVPFLLSDSDLAEVTELYVKKEFRRQGVGRTLIQHAVKLCADQNCSEVHVLVNPYNTVARAFYRAMGFELHSLA